MSPPRPSRRTTSRCALATWLVWLSLAAVLIGMGTRTDAASSLTASLVASSAPAATGATAPTLLPRQDGVVGTTTRARATEPAPHVGTGPAASVMATPRPAPAGAPDAAGHPRAGMTAGRECRGPPPATVPM